MQLKPLFAASFIFLFFCSCGPTIYEAAGLQKSKTTMHTLAIIPFAISIDSKRLPKGTTIGTLKESELKTGYDIQNDIYTWFLHRQNKFTVTFQDIDRTNAILKQNNIGYDDIILKDKGELCKLLGVTGIVSGKASLSKPMSEGAAVTILILAGGVGSTNRTMGTLTIHDSTSHLLWKYDYSTSGGIGSSGETVTDKLMKKASKRFPYTH